uniref:Endonuclease n=1 Tax=viral metagenome TaxID=1070528 RepID=A0A6C0DQ75_9ZZZZ
MVNCETCRTVKAFFNFPGEKKARFCSSHKSEGMVNVVNKTCENPICNGKRATFNIVGGKPKFCGEHATSDMINLSAKKCKGVNGKKCFTIPIYNYPNEKKGEYCVEHKLEGMINVAGKRCEESRCNVIAQFNIEGEKCGRFCSIHKLEGMIDIKHSRCEYEGCNVSPSYRFEQDTHCRFCSEHKLEGMIDGKHKKCNYSGCGKTPSFNYECEEIPMYCGEHKLEEMIDVKHDKCEVSGCILRPVFNFFSEKKGRFCFSHKLDNMEDVVSKTCISEWCNTNTNNSKYNGYCLFCYVNLFPDNPVSRNYKTKEKNVVDFVLENFPQFTWVSDKKVKDGCSRRRPDLLLDLGYQVIIIEIDENQHIDYDCSCENKRLMEISKDVGHRPIVFIRFNPDSYVNRRNECIKSCWKANQKGIFIINKENNKEWNNRLDMLISIRG